MKYAAAVVFAIGLLAGGCGGKAPDTPKSDEAGGESAADSQQTLQAMPPQLKDAESGERWMLQNRVPLMDEPSEYGNQEAFKKHMRAKLSAGTEIEVLKTGKDAWLKVRTDPDDGDSSREGWISANNVIRAKRLRPAE